MVSSLMVLSTGMNSLLPVLGHDTACRGSSDDSVIGRAWAMLSMPAARILEVKSIFRMLTAK